MLVFETQMHIITFFFVSVEVVIFFYLVIFRLARPDDRTVFLNIALIFLLLIYNITGGLLPDPKLPGSYFLQVSIAYATGFITPCYFPYYVYKAFGLTRLKYHAYKGVFLFLIIPYFLFVAAFAISDDLKVAQNLLILPVLYSSWLIILVIRSIRDKYNNNFSSMESKQELSVLLLSLAPWVSLPVISFLDIGQAIEASTTNIGFLLLFSLQVKQNIKQIRVDHEKLLESESRLRAWNTNLQDEVNKRTKELEKAHQTRSTNFINLVHETKTPLTLIQNYLDEYINKNGSAEELDIIKGSVDKLTTDVINLFDIERFSKGIDVYRHNKVSDFSEILKSSLPLFEYYCSKQNIKLRNSIEENIYLKADPNAINRIANNIIENAIKFTDEGGEITISLILEGGNILFSVQDNGVGISPSLQKKIFEPYYQIGNKNTSLQGMGLGLPIVKKVVDSLAGEIVIESNPSLVPGTKVLIILAKHDLKAEDIPIQSSKEASSPNYQFADYAIEDSAYLPERRSIFIVEDNKAMVHFLCTKFRGKYNVYYALNGADALKKLSELPVIPDLILSDIMMDKMDGFAFAQVLSDQANYNHIPIVFLTAKSTPTDRLKGLKLGAIDFVSKPFSFEELNQKIETILLNISKQQTAIINSSILNLKTLKNINIENPPVIYDSKFDQNIRLLSLTNREIEIAKLIVKGKIYREIATELFISEKTVTKHIQNMFEKADVSNKVGFINKLML
ncbi:MAG: response regulator [Prolixibacteraceae bacterium]|nr:response regulator [Prolixibacteraceae bacterium]